MYDNSTPKASQPISEEETRLKEAIGSNSPREPKVPAVAKSFEHLFSALQEVQQVTNQLEERLTPVLSPPEGIDKDARPENPHPPTVAGTISGIALELSLTVRRLRELKNRLEV